MQQNLSLGIRLLNTINDVDGDLFLCKYDFNKDQFLIVSENCLTMFGYEREELEGYPASDFTLEKHKALLQKTIKNNAINNSATPYVNIYVTKDGRKKMLLWGAQKPTDGVGLCYALEVTPEFLDAMNLLKSELDEN